MKKLAWMLPVLGLVAACDTLEGTQLATSATGAAVGAAVSGNGDKTEGALIGATAGLIAGTLLGQTANGQCVYQRADGTQYITNCPG